MGLPRQRARCFIYRGAGGSPNEKPRGVLLSGNLSAVLETFAPRFVLFHPLERGFVKAADLETLETPKSPVCSMQLFETAKEGVRIVGVRGYGVAFVQTDT